jgi:hypothetical protein
LEHILPYILFWRFAPEHTELERVSTLSEITQTEPTPNVIPGWSRLPGMGSVFHLGRYRDGLEALVGGSRGSWAWRIDRRLPPNFKGEVVATGEENTQRKAKLAAQAAMTAARQAMRAAEAAAVQALKEGC